MIIKFISLKFSNIMSFGNTVTTFDFKEGLNLIVGSNGSGKSAILDSLSYCLFGKPYRDVTIKELINRKNKKKLFTECEFQINNETIYRITRTLKPDSLKIVEIVNGEEKDLNLLSSKKLTQDEIDKIIGINHDMFKQVISLAVNYNKPFITLPLDKKRKILEQICNISVFGKMSKINKKKISDLGIKLDMNKKSVMLLENNVNTLKTRYIEIDEAKTNFENNKKTNLENIESKLKEAIDEKNECDEDIKKYTQLIDSMDEIKDKSEFRDKKYELAGSIRENEYEIKQSKIKIEKMNKISICPECNTEITEEHKNKEIDKFTKKINIAEANIVKLKQEESEIDNIIKNIEEQTELKNSRNQWMSIAQSKKGMREREIVSLNQHKKSILESKFEVNTESMKEELLTKYDELVALQNETKKLTADYDMCVSVNSILSDDGIKSFFFKSMVPVLNSKVNEYLRLFELPVFIKFDELMDAKIYAFSNVADEIAYNSYSEGEKKRIDMSILLSFIAVTKMISDWNCNLLMIDELLDGAIDDAGLEKLVQSLKSMTEINKDMGIYVISHRLRHEYGENFTNRISVRKQPNQFSVIT